MTLLEALEKFNEYDSQFSVGRFLLVVEDGQRTILYRTFSKEHEVVLDEYDLAILEHRLVKLADEWKLTTRITHGKGAWEVEIYKPNDLGALHAPYYERHYFNNDYGEFQNTAHALAVGLLEFKKWEAQRK